MAASSSGLTRVSSEASLCSASAHSQDMDPDGATEEEEAAEPRAQEGSLREQAVRGAAREIRHLNLLRPDVGTLGILRELGWQQEAALATTRGHGLEEGPSRNPALAGSAAGAGGNAATIAL